jgi:hypothetical protein
MNPNEFSELLKEKEYLYFLITHHTKNKSRIWDDEKEYDDYINAALERITEINILIKNFEAENNL